MYYFFRLEKNGFEFYEKINKITNEDQKKVNERAFIRFFLIFGSFLP